MRNDSSGLEEARGISDILQNCFTWYALVLAKHFLWKHFLWAWGCFQPHSLRLISLQPQLWVVSNFQEMMHINRFKNGRKKMFGQNQFLSSKMIVKDVWNSPCLPQTRNVIILNRYKFLEYLFNKLNKSMYRTRTIITRGFYSFYPLFEVQKRFFTELFS